MQWITPKITISRQLCILYDGPKILPVLLQFFILLKILYFPQNGIRFSILPYTWLVRSISQAQQCSLGHKKWISLKLCVSHITSCSKRLWDLWTDATEMYPLTVLNAQWSQRLIGRASSRDPKKPSELSLSFCGILAITNLSWSIDTYLCLHLHMAFLPLALYCLSLKLPFLIRTPVTGLKSLLVGLVQI